MSLLFYYADKIPADARNGDHPENTQRCLAGLSAPLHAKRHAVVLQEMYPEPVADHRVLFSYDHVCFNKNLDGLISDKDQKDQQDRFIPERHKHLYSVSYTHLRAHETDSYLVCRLLLE